MGWSPGLNKKVERERLWRWVKGLLCKNENFEFKFSVPSSQTWQGAPATPAPGEGDTQIPQACWLETRAERVSYMVSERP